jgi:hypothetical protein
LTDFTSILCPSFAQVYRWVNVGLRSGQYAIPDVQEGAESSRKR